MRSTIDRSNTDVEICAGKGLTFEVGRVDGGYEGYIHRDLALHCDDESGSGRRILGGHLGSKSCGACW